MSLEATLVRIAFAQLVAPRRPHAPSLFLVGDDHHALGAVIGGANDGVAWKPSARPRRLGSNAS